MGRHLSLFLKESAPWKNKKELSCLAGFEWELFVSSMVANPKQASLAPNMAANPANFFFLHPAVRVFQSAWEVDHATKAKIPHSREKLFWVIFRKNGKVKTRRIAKAQHEVLTLLFHGHALDSLVSTFEKNKTSQKQASLWFKRWTEEGIIAGFQNA